MIKQQIFPIETDFNWYDVNGLNEADSRRLQTEFYFTPEIISYVSDRHERPHYDYDQYTDTHLLVYDVPVWPTTTIKHFTSRPITFCYRTRTSFLFIRLRPAMFLTSSMIPRFCAGSHTPRM